MTDVFDDLFLEVSKEQRIDLLVKKVKEIRRMISNSNMASQDIHDELHKQRIMNHDGMIAALNGLYHRIGELYVENS